MFLLTLLALQLLVIQSMHGLVVQVSILEKKDSAASQTIILCGDLHCSGSWLENATQFLHFAQAISQAETTPNVLVENFVSSNEHFSGSNDLKILALKQSVVLDGLRQGLRGKKTGSMPTMLNFFGCSQDFYLQMGNVMRLQEAAVQACNKLRISNVDDRHQTVYYAESLEGWKYPPYDRPEFVALQQQEAQRKTLSDITAPMRKLEVYMRGSSPAAQNLFSQIAARQKRELERLQRDLPALLGQTNPQLEHFAMQQLQAHSGGKFYNYLSRSPLPGLLQEMIEANTLWEICKPAAPACTILFAGAHHTGQRSNAHGPSAPGLLPMLKQLGFQEVLSTQQQDNATESWRLPQVVREWLKSKRPLVGASSPDFK